uniref:Endonuclease/exonuclease/phosphatase domain-containing protein n=1 Tax=Ciona savignyi TaxID=51511 RepID=H2YGG8_CIOSA
MQRWQSRTGVQPSLLMCGDFNSTPNSPLHQLITSGQLNYKGIAAKQVSGQESHGGVYRELPPILLPQCLFINGNCTYASEKKAINAINYELSHCLGVIKSSNEPHTLEEATTMQNNGATVDYIFYSENNRPEGANVSQRIVNLELQGCLSHISAKDIGKIGGIPNVYHSSDHMPVVAQFRVTVK